MSKLLRNFLLAAAILIIFGGVVSGIGYALGGMVPLSITNEGIKLFGQSGQHTVVNESYRDLKSIEVNTDILELSFEEGDAFKVEGNYNPNIITLNISENNDALKIDSRSSSQGFFGWNWFNFGIGFGGGNINVLKITYPKNAEFESLKVTNDLGSLNMNDLSTQALNVKLNAGSFYGENITADEMDVDMDLGSCTINSLTSGKQSKFTMDAGSLSLTESSLTDTNAKLNLGQFDFSGLLEGNAEFSMDLGSINLDLENQEDKLGYSIETDLGSIHVNGKQAGSPANQKVSNPDCTMEVKSNLGSVNIETG